MQQLAGTAAIAGDLASQSRTVLLAYVRPRAQVGQCKGNRGDLAALLTSVLELQEMLQSRLCPVEGQQGGLQAFAGTCRSAPRLVGRVRHASFEQV